MRLVCHGGVFDVFRVVRQIEFVQQCPDAGQMSPDLDDGCRVGGGKPFAQDVVRKGCWQNGQNIIQGCQSFA